MTETEKILEMISEGKISASDGERLLNAIHGTPQSKVPEPKNNQSKVQLNDQKPNEGNIIIDIRREQEEIVKLKLPVSFAGFMLNMLPKEKISGIEMDGLNLQEILNNIPKMANGEDQEILNIRTEDGTSIKIYVKYE
jgi:hypothetical protein